MRILAALVFAVFSLAPAAAAPSVEELFHDFDLFGTWAADCNKEATPSNPHVSIAMPSPGLVREDHDLGPDFATNSYSVLSAARVSPTGLSVEVIFQPGTANEERQTLEFQIGKGTRRTMFNRTESGQVRVKGGVALGRGSKTPLLRKCG